MFHVPKKKKLSEKLAKIVLTKIHKEERTPTKLMENSNTTKIFKSPIY